VTRRISRGTDNLETRGGESTAGREGERKKCREGKTETFTEVGRGGREVKPSRECQKKTKPEGVNVGTMSRAAQGNNRRERFLSQSTGGRESKTAGQESQLTTGMRLGKSGIREISGRRPKTSYVQAISRAREPVAGGKEHQKKKKD